jgi:hypothetical protein
MQQPEAFFVALDDVPDLIGFVAKHFDHGQVTVVGLVGEIGQGVFPVVAEIDVQLGDGIQEVVEAAGDFYGAHIFDFSVCRGVIAADKDLFNAPSDVCHVNYQKKIPAP